MTNEDSQRQTDIEWERRTLCSDENCIGVIGKDGRCKECGLPYDGELPPATSSVGESDVTDGAETEDDAPRESANNPAEADASDTSPDTDDEWEKRTLCSDGNCIGVIGPDGRCKECGKLFEAGNLE